MTGSNTNPTGPTAARRRTRRAFLAGVAAATTGLAGCFGTSDGGATGPKNGDDLPSDSDPDDGYPPAFEDTPTSRSVNTDAFDTTTVEGTAVPLAPVEDVYYWYARREARFVDARGPSSYDRSHVFGAVLSPAPNGTEGSGGDPVDQWPKDARVVCYCSCPHHLSSLRAASLLSEGYRNVFVIDEGFREWHDRNYPVAGQRTERLPPIRVVEGRTDAAFAGETAWARHLGSGQREATRIRSDGAYRLELPFAGVTDSSVVAVRTPAYRVEAPLGELTAGTLTGRDAAGRGTAGQ
ncbi:rhodanese-like domain-containing protein [Halorussus sp. AFM4]|uniref:rhodanese-like domain-containing protein n=1 Tax=Halorussus sp. AFM4 TaxID=3421651 RepID=UPI003EBB2824